LTNLKLLWDSFHFYTGEITELEQVHVRNTSRLANSDSDFLKNKHRSLKTVHELIALYQKQKFCLSEILDYHQDADDIPEEYQVDDHLLQSLQEMTDNLILDMKKTQSKLEKY